MEIRTYGLSELAILYLPNINNKSASNQLSKWINSNNKLYDELVRNGYKSRQKILTPKQVNIIIDFLGEP